jgi:hAT family C-terminal dimerisation region
MEPRRTKEFVYNNPLLWWKMHDEKFFTLQILARKFLAIQASSAPSECVFSQALLISNKQTRMDPTIVGKVLFIKQNWEHFEGKVDYLKVIAGREYGKHLKELE